MWTKKSQEVERIIMEMRRKTCFQDTGKGRCLGKILKRAAIHDVSGLLQNENERKS